MITKIPEDLYSMLFTELSLQDIVNLCNTSQRFRTYCLTNQKFIAKVKCKALRKLLEESDKEIREFAFKHKLCFDKQSETRAIKKHGKCVVENTFTIQLIYLVNTHLYDEAYVKLTCEQVVEPNGTYIFRSNLFDGFPERLVKLYMDRLPPILELFGYDNVNDFYDDWPLESFRNDHLREYIKENVLANNR
jgi:hypothetical protein